MCSLDNEEVVYSLPYLADPHVRDAAIFVTDYASSWKIKIWEHYKPKNDQHL